MRRQGKLVVWWLGAIVLVGTAAWLGHEASRSGRPGAGGPPPVTPAAHRGEPVRVPSLPPVQYHLIPRVSYSEIRPPQP
jgi:hypothetical protein